MQKLETVAVAYYFLTLEIHSDFDSELIFCLFDEEQDSVSLTVIFFATAAQLRQPGLRHPPFLASLMQRRSTKYRPPLLPDPSLELGFIQHFRTGIPVGCKSIGKTGAEFQFEFHFGIGRPFKVGR